MFYFSMIKPTEADIPSLEMAVNEVSLQNALVTAVCRGFNMSIVSHEVTPQRRCWNLGFSNTFTTDFLIPGNT